MSALQDELRATALNTINTRWKRVNGYVVPTTDDITLKDGAKEITATFLYADLAGSSALAHGYIDEDVARVIKSYVTIASKLISHHDGEIRSVDGDRVMGIFIGAGRSDRAVQAAFKVTYMVDFVLNPLLKEKLHMHAWRMQHGVGIASGKAMMIRAGVRGHNDLMAIGEAPNVAAKLSEVRVAGDRWVHITQDVWDEIPFERCYTYDNPTEPLWTSKQSLVVAPGFSVDYRSSWRWIEP